MIEGFLICKKGPDDVNIFTKSLAHISTFEFYRLVKIFQSSTQLTLGYMAPTATDIEEFLDRPIFINQRTKLSVCSSNPFIIVAHPQIS